MGEMKRLGILTGGGDCPGLNAAIRATAKTVFDMGYEVVGIRNGWKGLAENNYKILDGENTSGIIDKGGTILGTSRWSPFRVENGPQQIFNAFENLRLEALVVLGGEGTLSLTNKLFEMGLPVVGIPKTIDNDVRETDYTIGFQTAVQIATEALDRLRSTAESHHRVMFLEVMGRYTGWIATYAGMANGADAILIPEIPLDKERVNELCNMLKTRNQRGTTFSVVVVAEGTLLEGKNVGWHNSSGDENRYKLGGIGRVIGEIIERETGLETRVSSLDYIQRGGTPVAYDRSLATAFGIKAIELVKDKRYGQMAALKGNKISSASLEKVADGIKTVNLNVYRMAEIFFG
jgi:6-phosphofructokinase 1